MLRTTQKKCRTCGKRCRFEKHTYGVAVHILLAVFTLGAYLLCLPFMLLFGNKFRCTVCGGR